METVKKFCLVFIILSLVSFCASCKKSEENSKDVAVVTGIASAILSDVQKFGVAAAAGAAQGDCTYNKTQEIINKAPSFVINPSPGHGWYSGSITETVQTSCNIDYGIMTTCNCVLGATYVTGESVGGTLNIDGDGHLNYSTTPVNYHLDIHSGSTGLEIEGHTYTVSLYCLLWANSSGVHISIKGQMGDQDIDYTSTL